MVNPSTPDISRARFRAVPSNIMIGLATLIPNRVTHSSCQRFMTMVHDKALSLAFNNDPQLGQETRTLAHMAASNDSNPSS